MINLKSSLPLQLDSHGLAIFEYLTDAVVILHPDDEAIIFANLKAARLYEYERDELTTMSMLQMSVNTKQDLVTKMRNEGVVKSVVSQQITKSGKVLDVIINAFFIQINGKEYIVSVNKDVSETVKLGKEVQRTDSYLKAVFESSASSHFIVDENLILLNYNRNFKINLARGYNKVIELGSNIMEVIPVECEPKFGEWINRSTLGEHVRFEYKFELLNKQMWLDISFTPIYNNYSVFLGVAVRINDITKIKAEQTELKTTKAALDHISNGAIITDALVGDHPIIYANKAFYSITGYAPEDVLGKNCRFLQGEDKLQEDLIVLRTAIKSQIGCKVVLRNYRKDGTMFWNELTISPILNESNLVTHFVGIQKDISEEVARFSIERRQREIIKHASKLAKLGGWEIDLTTMQQICSEEVVNIREDESHQLITPIEYGLEFYPKEYKNLVAHSIQRILQHGGDCEMESPFITKKGTKKWVRSRGTAVSENEKIIKVYGVLQDITEEKEREDKIAKSNKELADYKSALDVSSIVAITNATGMITYVNDNFCKISEYHRDELIGNSHVLVNSGFHTNGFFRDMWAQISKGKSWRGEIKNKSKSGKFYWVDTFIIPFLDDNKRPSHYVSIRYDITKRKNQEFFIANALEEKEILLNEIHHRVKNNLQIVTSLMNIQKNQLNNPLVKELFDDMQNRIIAMSLIHDTIYQTKNYSFIDAYMYFKSIINNMKGALSGKKININLEIEQGIALGVSTATNCGIIINEALTNSLKHAFNNPPPMPVVSISLTRAQERDLYTLRISDNGSGSVHCDDQIKEATLGLSLIEGLTKQMNGVLTIDKINGFMINIIFRDNKKS
jgi:PAS domain S-box-containing protein